MFILLFVTEPKAIIIWKIVFAPKVLVLERDLTNLLHAHNI